MAARVTVDRMKRRRQSRLFSVAAVGILCTAIVWSSRSPSESNADPVTQIVAEYNTVPIPVPREPVPAGVRVKDIAVKVIQFPEHQLPMGSLRELTGHLEAFTVAPLPAGYPIDQENVSFVARANNPVIGKIPQGMRAMTVKVDATSSVEGWAGSGSIVDVLLVEKDRTSVIAENVRVLSAERSVSPVEGSAAPSVPTTVTLLVTQDQCLAINTAIPRGRMAFALRSGSDEARWDRTLFTADQLPNASASSRTQKSISGYVEIEGGRKFALSEGKWLETDGKPAGFFANEQ